MTKPTNLMEMGKNIVLFANQILSLYDSSMETCIGPIPYELPKVMKAQNKIVNVDLIFRL